MGKNQVDVSEILIPFPKEGKSCPLLISIIKFSLRGEYLKSESTWGRMEKSRFLKSIIQATG